jgi:putative transposase
MEDHFVYIRLLQKFLAEFEVRLWAYALMPNHVHLIVVPPKEDSLSALIHRAHGGYADFFNALYGTVGHLWQGRFNSSAMDEGYFWNAVRYVERNPVRSGLVSVAEEYRWSSAAAHCGLRHDPLLSNDLPHNPLIRNWSMVGCSRPTRIKLSDPAKHSERATLRFRPVCSRTGTPTWPIDSASEARPQA